MKFSVHALICHLWCCGGEHGSHYLLCFPLPHTHLLSFKLLLVILLSVFPSVSMTAACVSRSASLVIFRSLWFHLNGERIKASVVWLMCPVYAFSLVYTVSVMHLCLCGGSVRACVCVCVAKLSCLVPLMVMMMESLNVFKRSSV